MTDSAHQSPGERIQGLISEHGIWLTAVLTVIVFAGLFIYADGDELLRTLVQVPLRVFVIIIGLTTVGYIFRFLKWHMYLHQLDIAVSLPMSLLTFISGLMMVVTPGKAGELWKAWFLRDNEDVPVSKTASVVGAERLTDLIGLSVMAMMGVLVFQRSSLVLVAVVGVILLGIVILQWKRLCLGILKRVEEAPKVGEFAASFREFYENTYELFQAKPLGLATGLSIVAWGLEGVALWFVLSSLGGEASVVVGIFVFGLGSVIGAISLLPGGLGAAEASMFGLLVTFGYSEATAAAATIVIRVGTLWYAAALGIVVFSAYKTRRSLR